MNRRTFCNLAASAAIASTLSSGITNNATAKPFSLSDPIPRNGKPKFKFSLAAYSYRNLLTGETPKLTLADFISDCAEFDLDGTELTSYYFPENPSGPYIRKLKEQCFRLGLDVSGTAIRNDFGFANPNKRKEQIDHVKKWIDFAEIFGAPVIRIFAGHQKDGITEAKTHSLIVSAIEECCEYAGKHGVFLALENHGGPTSTAKGLLKFVRDVQSPWFGVNLDTGNFHSEKIYDEIKEVAPYALNVQIKVVVSGPDKEKKPADFARVAEILKASNYRGYIVLEYEEGGNPKEECPKFLDELREAFTTSR